MSDQLPELNQYVRAVISRLWLVAILVILAVGAAYWRAGRAPDQYSATATLLVTAPVITPSPPVADGGDPSFRPTAVVVTNDILNLITTYPIASRVAERLGLPSPGAVQTAITAESIRGTSLIRVAAVAGSPELAADLANTTAKEFVAYFRETNRASMAEVRRFTEIQLAQARARLEASERAIQAFKERRQMPSVPDAASQIMAQAASIRVELDNAVTARRENEARLQAAQARLAQEEPTLVSSRATTDNPVFRRLQARLVDLELQRMQLSQVYTAQHPRMEQITREIADVRTRLTTEAQTTVGEEVISNNPIRARLLSDIVTLEAERAAIGARIQALQTVQRQRAAAAGAIPSAESEFNRMEREHKVLEANYTALSSRHQEILLRENQAGFFPASLQLIEAARPPVRPAPSPFPRAAAAAAASGLVLGIIAAFVLDAADDRIRGAQDAARALGLPVLAQIPAQGYRARAAVPATAIIAVGVILAATAALGAAARGYVSFSPEPVIERVRVVTTTATSWVDDLTTRARGIGASGGRVVETR